MHQGTESPPMKHPSVSDAAEPRSSPSTGARRGRPLGTHCREGTPKEKVTFRISSDLAGVYRNWSWETGRWGYSQSFSDYHLDPLAELAQEAAVWIADTKASVETVCLGHADEEPFSDTIGPD